MPQLDENSIEIVKRFAEEHRGDYGQAFLEAIDLFSFTFIDFSGAQIELTSKFTTSGNNPKEYYLVCYDKLDWDSDELDEVENRIGDHELYEFVESNGKYHKFHFRVPSYDEVRNGLPYFRNVYNI